MWVSEAAREAHVVVVGLQEMEMGAGAIALRPPERRLVAARVQHSTALYCTLLRREYCNTVPPSDHHSTVSLYTFLFLLGWGGFGYGRWGCTYCTVLYCTGKCIVTVLHVPPLACDRWGGGVLWLWQVGMQERFSERAQLWVSAISSALRHTGVPPPWDPAQGRGAA